MAYNELIKNFEKVRAYAAAFLLTKQQYYEWRLDP